MIEQLLSPRDVLRDERYIDEEGIPLDAPGNRNSIDITKPWHFKGSGRTEYFIPTLMCFVIKSIGNVSLPEMRLTACFTLIIRFDLSELNAEQKEFVQENIKFRIDERELDNPYMKKNLRNNTLSITYRSNGEEFYFYPNLSKLPFDKPLISLKFEMTSVENTKTKENFRFNCLAKKDILGNSGMISFKDNSDRIPEYNLALSEIEIERPMEGKTNLEGSEWNYIYYPITIIKIPLYREPENLIFSIVMPLTLLNLFTLTVFMLEPSDFATKLGILVTVMLAVFAFTFSVRGSLPEVPYLTDLEKQIIISLIVTFIAGIGSVVEFVTTDDTATFTVKYLLGGFDSFIVIVNIVHFLALYSGYRKECNAYDAENEEHVKNSKVKMQSAQPDFKFSECVGRGLNYKNTALPSSRK